MSKLSNSTEHALHIVQIVHSRNLLNQCISKLYIIPIDQGFWCMVGKWAVGSTLGLELSLPTLANYCPGPGCDGVGSWHCHGLPSAITRSLTRYSRYIYTLDTVVESVDISTIHVPAMCWVMFSSWGLTAVPMVPVLGCIAIATVLPHCHCHTN